MVNKDIQYSIQCNNLNATSYIPLAYITYGLCFVFIVSLVILVVFVPFDDE